MWDLWCGIYDVWCDVWFMMFDLWCGIYDVGFMIGDLWCGMCEVWCVSMICEVEYMIYDLRRVCKFCRLFVFHKPNDDLLTDHLLFAWSPWNNWPIRHSLINHWRLTIHNWPFTIDHWQLTIDDSPLTIHHFKLTINPSLHSDNIYLRG